MKKLLFIVNPRAGKTKSTAPLFDAVAAFSRAGYLVRVFVTEAGGQARDIAAKWGGQYDLVVCAGGDGTLNETISGLMQLEQRPPLGYLPNGSTNDFAASLHLHTTVATAARAVAGGIPYSLDIGRHNDRYFAYVASFGAFTRSSYSASQAAKNALGHFAYILEGLGDLDSLRPYRCAIDADGEHFEGDFIFGAVCNSTSLGGLVKLDPKHVSMNDGTLELLLLRMPKTALDLQNLITAMTRMQYDYPGVIFRHVKNVVLTTNENISWSLDGEYAAFGMVIEGMEVVDAIASAPRNMMTNKPKKDQVIASVTVDTHGETYPEPEKLADPFHR